MSVFNNKKPPAGGFLLLVFLKGIQKSSSITANSGFICVRKAWFCNTCSKSAIGTGAPMAEPPGTGVPMQGMINVSLSSYFLFFCGFLSLSFGLLSGFFGTSLLTFKE
ncbi:hypothetical protein NE616_03590 [Enterobacteriaceae bacterium DFI.7.85]|nr:hypothetical protein [Enterobacteriaceae bacterium DFI.7.85]